MDLSCRMRREDAGFTLIEVLTVVVVIAILASILLATFLKARAQSAVAASKGNVKNIATALETYFTDLEEYPVSLETLVPTYARAIPDDPCTNDPYVYEPSAGSPISDYRLSITFPLTSACRLVIPGLSYTPGTGLVDSP